MTRKPAPIDPDLQRDRFGHNNQGAVPHYSRITYLASAKGYVMARRPGCTPFAISEKLWRSFDYWPGEQPRTKAHTSARVHPAATAVLIGEQPNPLLDLPTAQLGKPGGYPDAGAGDIPGVNPSDLNCC